MRKPKTINEERCNGCGLCADACHEDDVGIVNGKGKLLRRPRHLPARTNVLNFETREAPF
ncbi:4Fe-4S binding protein [Candidatus Desulfovibrio trichonymphae]|uniref:4Fe-4S binding protein n=1 Tax=Candidatus Desulfovibrio trichonymphae TaxID=1725232 RepID=UPI0038B75F98